MSVAIIARVTLSWG